MGTAKAAPDRGPFVGLVQIALCLRFLENVFRSVRGVRGALRGHDHRILAASMARDLGGHIRATAAFATSEITCIRQSGLTTAARQPTARMEISPEALQ
jgi:hypothetical protein